ncbi:MAG: universal stress protein [Chloroflexi bacterium]|nr:universal stress protein [Chloroflexota bacterium]
MFDKILLSLDGSELAESAVPYARELAECLGSEVHMLGVCDLPRLPERLLKAYIDTIATKFKRAGLRAQPMVLCGVAADVILDYAEKSGIGLVVMASHGRSGVTRWVLGSVADKVLHSVTIPLFLVNTKLAAAGVIERKTFRRLLLPLDGSDTGEAAVPYAEELARKTNARILLLNVALPAYRIAATQDYPGIDLEPIIKAQREASENYLQGVEAKLKQKGLAVSSETLVGSPAESILDYAKQKQADVIAMSTHGRSGFGRWILGSVTDKVTRAAQMPVMVIRASGPPHGLV